MLCITSLSSLATQRASRTTLELKMTENTILYHKAQFHQFKKFSSTRIESICAPETAEFSLVMAKNKNGNIGFDQSEEGHAFIKSLIENCYFLNIQNELYPPQDTSIAYVPQFLFRDKDGKFERLYKEHKKYKSELKKYEILSRHRAISPPTKSALAIFLDDPTLSINSDTYELLTSSCHYICIAKISGEYGHGAFDVFANDLDFFFKELKILATGKFKITAIDNNLKLIKH